MEAEYKQWFAEAREGWSMGEAGGEKGVGTVVQLGKRVTL